MNSRFSILKSHGQVRASAIEHYTRMVASGLWPDVEGGILPPGSKLPVRREDCVSNGCGDANVKSAGRDARLYGRPEARRYSGMVRAHRRGAFSLIEVMVAVSLLAVIIVGLLAMFYQVQRAFRAGTAQADILESGRATMNLVTRDFQELTACHLTNDLIFNCLITPSLPDNGPSLQDLPTGSRRTNWFQDIAFLTRRNDEWTATAYRVAYGTNGVGTLYRMVQRTNRWTLFEDSSNAVRSLTLTAGRDFYSMSNLYNRVVEGVVAFDVRPLDTNGLPFPDMNPSGRASSNPQYRWKPNVIIENGRGIFEFGNDATPAYLDVELAILEPSALTRFRVQEEIGGVPSPQARSYLGRQIGRTHVFRQRVAILPSVIELSVR